MIQKSIQILKKLQHPTGLFSASAKHVATGYNRAWLRDNVYESLGLEAVQSFKEVVKTYRALLDILLKHENKIDWAIKEKPDAAFKYIHARYDPASLNEIWEEWGNKQNDAIGAILFKIGELEEKGIKIIRNENDLRILQKLVLYLKSIQYWQDKDNGMWEENEEVHASSVGACAAGLKKISKLVEVPKELIQKGIETLNKLLPRESETKEADLALLSLIYPYNIINKKQREEILKNIEEKLVRERGVIRYLGDQYYNENSIEPSWTMGFPWLAVIYGQMNKPNKYAYYMRKCVAILNEKGELPELYIMDKIPNENTPLGWSQSLLVVAASLI